MAQGGGEPRTDAQPRMDRQQHRCTGCLQRALCPQRVERLQGRAGFQSVFFPLKHASKAADFQARGAAQPTSTNVAALGALLPQAMPKACLKSPRREDAVQVFSSTVVLRSISVLSPPIGRVTTGISMSFGRKLKTKSTIKIKKKKPQKIKSNYQRRSTIR